MNFYLIGNTVVKYENGETLRILKNISSLHFISSLTPISTMDNKRANLELVKMLKSENYLFQVPNVDLFLSVEFRFRRNRLLRQRRWRRRRDNPSSLTSETVRTPK